MFDQVRVLIPHIFVVTSIHPFVFYPVVVGQVPKEDSTLQNIIAIHTQDGIAWDVDLCHNCLEVVIIFKSNNPHINNMKNIHR